MRSTTKKIDIKKRRPYVSPKKSYVSPNKPYVSPKKSYVSPNNTSSIKLNSRKSKTKFEDIFLGEQITRKSPTKNSLTKNSINEPKNSLTKNSINEPRKSLTKNLIINEPRKSLTKNSLTKNSLTKNSLTKKSIINEPRKSLTKNSLTKKSIINEPRKNHNNVNNIKYHPLNKIEPTNMHIDKITSNNIPTSVNNNYSNKIIQQKYNITKKEYLNKTHNHKQGILDKYYAQKYSNPINTTNKLRNKVSKKITNKKKSNKTTNIPIKKNQKSPSNLPTYNEFKKVTIKTNINYYEISDSYLRFDLLEKTIDKLQYYRNIPNIEDRYLTSIITDGVVVNKISSNI